MSEVKVNKITPRAACGTTQLGDSGDTFTIPVGATISNLGTATGFGATGAASWNTTVKTGDFTAVNGEGYFVNTTSGEIDVALPAGTAGAVVAVKDYAGTFDTTNCILVPNGSDKIGGVAASATIATEGLAVTLVYIDAVQGWLVTDSGLQDEAPGPKYVAATGGCITTCGNYKIHTFLSPATFTVCSVGNSIGSNSVDYLVIAGGGGGGTSGNASSSHGGSGGGAGGYRFSNGTASGCFTTAPGPLAPLGASALPVAATAYPITVGGGGPGSPSPSSSPGTQGNTATFSTISSAGGGGGGSRTPTGGSNGGSGGSGGGANTLSTAGSGNTPPVSPPQGNSGGTGGNTGSPGGGGIGSVGVNTPDCNAGGNGGNGIASSITGTPVARGGGGGGSGIPTVGTGQAGGGNGAPDGPGANGCAGTANTGGGGGGGARHPNSSSGGQGGSGIVIIRYKYQ